MTTLEEVRLQTVFQEIRERTEHGRKCSWRGVLGRGCTCDWQARADAEVARRWAASIEAALDPYVSDEGMCTHEMGDRAEKRDEQRKADGREAAVAAAQARVEVITPSQDSGTRRQIIAALVLQKAEREMSGTGFDWHTLACELNVARHMVESEVAECSARMQLTTNSHMPSWSRYAAAQRAWDTAMSAFLDSVGTRPE